MSRNLLGIIHQEANSENAGRIQALGDGRSYPFLASDTVHKLSTDSGVVFQTSRNLGGRATAIRPVYRNAIGLYFYPRAEQSHIHVDLRELLPVMAEYITDAVCDFVEYTHDFGKVVGRCICVSTSERDRIVYGIRRERKGYSRLVKGRSPQPTSQVTMVLKRDSDLAYEIISIYYGAQSAREPWDRWATADDKLFWKNHALIFDQTCLDPKHPLLSEEQYLQRFAKN